MDLFLFTSSIFTWYLNCVQAQSAKFDYFKAPPVKYVCPNLEVTNPVGEISSPFYPNVYPSHLSCSWHIQGNVGDIITIKFDDIDIEESCCCESHPCCLMNWLKIGPLANATDQKFCGKEIRHHHSVTSTTNKLWIKFHISEFSKGGRGFHFHYAIVPSSSARCTSEEFKCLNNKCVPSTERCNGVPDCNDGSDELDCSNRCTSGRSCRSVFQCYDASKHCDGIADCPDFSDEIDCGYCASNYVRCSHNSSQCYHPVKERCDRVFNCLNGADELDCFSMCPGKVTCDSRRGCYTVKQRCNGVTQCEDASDEKNCVPELCNYEHGGFLCDNRRCIEQIWTCDRTDDCGDGSDERNCLRNSVLTAALMGSLICALLLVIAISCTCRLHALRMLESRIINRETPLSRLSREFMFREPPPSYAVAVQNDPRHNLCVENLHYGVPVHRGRRRSRRSRHSRSHRPQVPPNVSLEPGRPIPPSPPPPISDVELLDDMSVHVSGNSRVQGHQQSAPNVKSEDTLKDSSRANEGSVSKELGGNKIDETVMSHPCPVVEMQQSQGSNHIRPHSVSAGESSDNSPVAVDGNFYCDSDTEPLVV